MNLYLISCAICVNCVLTVFVGCNRNDPNIPRNEKIRNLRILIKGSDYFICEINELRNDDSRVWVGYKVSSVDGRKAINEWITSHWDAIIKAEKEEPPEVYPSITLYMHTKKGISQIPLNSILLDPCDTTKPKDESRYIEIINKDDLDHLRDLATKHGYIIDWSKETVDDPSEFLSHPSRN